MGLCDRSMPLSNISSWFGPRLHFVSGSALFNWLSLSMESVAADVQKTSQLLSTLSPRAHSLNLRCFLKFPPALPNLSVCGYHDPTGLPYPQ